MFRLNPFNYIPSSEYDFNIIPNNNNNTFKPTESKKIENSINLNYKYIASIYNTLINSDILIRDFTITCGEKDYKAFIICIDGLINNNLVNNFILRPLMMKNMTNSFNNLESLN